MKRKKRGKAMTTIKRHGNLSCSEMECLWLIKNKYCYLIYTAKVAKVAYLILHA